MSSGALPVLVLVLVLAVVLLLVFGLVWKKDRDRTQEQAGDDERLDP